MVVTCWRVSTCFSIAATILGWQCPHETVTIPAGTEVGTVRTGTQPPVVFSTTEDRPIIAYCKTGIRSAEALALLKQAGFADAKHVQGGVTAWATQVDNSQPVY